MKNGAGQEQKRCVIYKNNQNDNVLLIIAKFLIKIPIIDDKSKLKLVWQNTITYEYVYDQTLKKKKKK